MLFNVRSQHADHAFKLVLWHMTCLDFASLGRIFLLIIILFFPEQYYCFLPFGLQEQKIKELSEEVGRLRTIEVESFRKDQTLQQLQQQLQVRQSFVLLWEPGRLKSTILTVQIIFGLFTLQAKIYKWLFLKDRTSVWRGNKGMLL